MFECTIIPTNTHVSGRSCRLSVRMFVCAHIYCCNLVEELPSVNYLTSLQSVCKRVYVCVCWVVIWSKKSQVWITWWAFKTFRSRMRVCICVRGFLLKTRVCTSLQVMRLDSFETHVSSGNYLKLEKGVPDFWKMEVSQIWKGGPRLLKNGSVCKSSEVSGGSETWLSWNSRVSSGMCHWKGGPGFEKWKCLQLSRIGMYLGGYLIMRQGKIRVPDSLPDRTRKCCGNTFELVFSHFFVFVGV